MDGPPTGQERDRGTSTDILDEETYEALLTELLITNQSFTTQSDSAQVDSSRNALFERYGVPQARFMEAHRHFEQDQEAQMERLLRIKDLVQQEMMSISDHIREQEAAERLRQDSIRAGLDPARQRLQIIQPGQ